MCGAYIRPIFDVLCALTREKKCAALGTCMARLEEKDFLT